MHSKKELSQSLFLYNWHPEMIKIQDSWCVIGLVFPQMVNKALVKALEA